MGEEGGLFKIIPNLTGGAGEGELFQLGLVLSLFDLESFPNNS